MSMDMTEFYEVFFEEAAELLAQMEHLLVELDVDNPDSEQLNAIFRAAHSIKGGAATFGFNDTAEVTHVMESLLDQVRKGEKRLRREMIDACLAAGDVVKGQLAGRRGDGTADESAAADVCNRLKAFAAEQAQPASQAPTTQTAATAPAPQSAAVTPVAQSAAATVTTPTVAATPAPAAAAGNCYGIEFEVDGQPQDTVALRDHVFSGLERMGTVAFIKGARSGGVIADAAAAVQQFALELVTATAEEDVWELLAFNVDPKRVKVSAKITDPAQPQTAPAPAAGQEDAGYGFFDELYNAVAAPPPPEAEAAESETESGAKTVAEAPAEAPAKPQSQGRRAADDPAVGTARAGRRETDKIAVTPGAQDASSIRVNIEKVDLLVNLVGELVITQAMLAQTVSKIDPVSAEILSRSMSQFERNMRDLQEAVMSIRMMPISVAFNRFPRVVRDLAGRLNKQVELKMQGEATELDKGLIEKITDPLNHLVRNSLDHGIEPPAQRLAAGKPEKGTITLRAFHEGGSILVEVCDDGAGLNREKILAKAKERGLPVRDDMTDAEVWQIVLEPGFSTADVVTDVSGRGVGMDVVKRNILSLSGSIDIESAQGVGTRMSIRLPLTLAILDGMSVAVGGEVFVIPLTAIVESFRPQAKDVKTVRGQDRVVHVRGEYLPVVALHEVFNMQSHAASVEHGIFVILEADGAKKAIYVDELLGQQQVVIKSLEGNYRKLPGISGATIMGDGRVALILDVGAIVRLGGGRALRAA